MSSILPILAIPSGCTPKDAAPDTPVENATQVLGAESKPVADGLFVFDGSSAMDPKATSVIPPLIAEELFAIADDAYVRPVGSWDEFDTLLAGYASVGVLVIWTHSSGLKELSIAGKQRTVSALASKLSRTGMPTIASIALEGCILALDVGGMLYAADLLQLNSLTAWPVYSGFHYTRVSTLPEALLTAEYGPGFPHVVTPKTMQEAEAKDVIVYGYTYAGDLEQPHFPMPEKLPESGIADPFNYRTDQGYPARSRAQTLRIPKSVLPGSNEALAFELRLNAYYATLRDRQPGSDADPYESLFQVIVS